MRQNAKGPRARARRHDWVDERSRALGAAVADKLWDDPSLLRVAHDNLERWECIREPEPVLEEWRTILSMSSLEELRELLTEESERARRVRQSSPFAGVLSPEERRAIFRRYESL